MAHGETATVLQTLYSSGTVGGLSDAELLARFARREGDAAEAAFHALVTRHGPMVLGVCRRALADPHDIDDAFQATFLILVRKAMNIRVHDSLGRWLYGVSRRVAARARSNASRRSKNEISRVEPIATAPDHDRLELMTALDQEIAKLPDRYRSAVILCDLDGLTQEAAARELKCPVGTVASRLSRGRERLKEKLTRRGLSPSIVASPGVSSALTTATVRSLAGVNSVSLHVLISDVSRELTMLKLKATGVGLASVLAVGGFATLAAHGFQTGNEPPPKVEQAKPEKVAGIDIPLDAPPPLKIGDVLKVEVLEALAGRPITGNRIVRPDGTISLEFYGDINVFGMNREQIKVKVIQHLRKFIKDEVLGLVEVGPDGKETPVDPADSNMVFVEEVSTAAQPRDFSGDKLDEVLRSLNELRRRVDADPSRPQPASRKPKRAGAPVGNEEAIEKKSGLESGRTPGVDLPADAPAPVKIGDVLRVEVLQALPGRPITGERIVRPDGTISLEFYGDLYVFGLNRKEIKVKVIEHLRKLINDEWLGLLEVDKNGKLIPVAPIDSSRVFVVEDGSPPSTRDSSDDKLGKMLRAVNDLKREAQAAKPRPDDSAPYPLVISHERRIMELEKRLEQMIEGSKKKP